MKAKKRRKRPLLHFSDEAKAWLESYHWPGNYRDLEAIVIYAATSPRVKDEIPVEAFLSWPRLEKGRGEVAEPPELSSKPDYVRAVRELTRAYPEGWTTRDLSTLTGASLSACQSHVKRAAKDGRLIRLSGGKRGSQSSKYVSLS